MVAKGLSYRQIAERLVLSHRTVQNHVGNTLRKLQMQTGWSFTHTRSSRGSTRSSRTSPGRPSDLGAAVAPVAAGVAVDRVPQVPAVDVGPEHVGEDEFSVRRPGSMKFESRCSRRPPHQVGVGDLGT